MWNKFRDESFWSSPTNSKPPHSTFTIKRKPASRKRGQESTFNTMEINNAQYSTICRSICRSILRPFPSTYTLEQASEPTTIQFPTTHFPVPIFIPSPLSIHPFHPRNSIFPICRRLIVECVAYYINWMDTQYMCTHLQSIIIITISTTYSTPTLWSLCLTNSFPFIAPYLSNKQYTSALHLHAFSLCVGVYVAGHRHPARIWP